MAGDPEPAPRRKGLEGTRDGWRARAELWMVRRTVAALLALPDGARDRAVAALARAGYALDLRHTRAAERYIAQALGEDLPGRLRSRYIRSSYELIARMTLDSFLRPERIAEDRVLEHFDLECGPEFRSILEQRRPIVLISCHVGDWEASGMLLKHFGFFPLHVVAKPTRNRPLSIWIRELRERTGLHMLSRYGAIQEGIAAVARGGSLLLFLDHRATMRPVFVPFFGRPAACERSSGVLLRRLKVPAVVAACYRTERPWHYRVVVPRVFGPDELSRMPVEGIVAAVNAELEKLILAHPEQYYWLHDRFRPFRRHPERRRPMEEARPT